MAYMLYKHVSMVMYTVLFQSLNENNFTSDGIEELCNTIRKSTTLVKLSLSGTSIVIIINKYQYIYNILAYDMLYDRAHKVVSNY